MGSQVVEIGGETSGLLRALSEEKPVIPDEMRMPSLRDVETVIRVLGEIDADYLTHQDRKRLGSAVDRLLELATRLALPPAQVSRGVTLSKREKLVLLHIRRCGRVMRSNLLVKLRRYHINASALSSAIRTLVRAGIVAEQREVARNGHIKTTYYVMPVTERADDYDRVR